VAIGVMAVAMGMMAEATAMVAEVIPAATITTPDADAGLLAIDSVDGMDVAVVSFDPVDDDESSAVVLPDPVLELELAGCSRPVDTNA